MTEQTRTGTDRTILLAGAILVGGLGCAVLAMMVQQQQMRRAISTHRTMADELLAGLEQLDAILGPSANAKPAPSMNGAARASSREATAGDNHDTAPGAPPLA